MIAYNPRHLDNLAMQRQADEALAKGLILRDDAERIHAAYPCPFYMPNFFVRAGIFLLTLVIVLAGVGLLMLIFGATESTAGVLLLFVALGLTVALEWSIAQRNFYRAGVDDALQWASVTAALVALNLMSDGLANSLQAIVILLLCAWTALRYRNSAMAVAAFAALLWLTFDRLTATGSAGRALAPLALIGISGLLYLLAARASVIPRWRHWQLCLLTLRFAGLTALYLAGNYYIIREFHFYDGLAGGHDLFFGLSWGLTICLPLVYILAAVRNKDFVLLWIGMAAIAGTILTVRYYFHFFPIEWMMVLGGLALMAAAYGLILFLRLPRKGITSGAPAGANAPMVGLAEGMMLAESWKHVGLATADPQREFGGGSGGGAGATGGF